MDAIQYQLVLMILKKKKKIFVFRLILVFVTIACCCAVQLGVYPWLMFWACIFSYFAFYCAHWQTYVSGKLKFGKYVQQN
jgi:hypothetical protein